MKLTTTPAIKILNNPNVRHYYVCGGMHGMHTILINKLRSMGFDPLLDRLVCTGDLADRGMQNRACANLLKEDWFESVIGNHEGMLIEGARSYAARQFHIQNGGGWFYELDDAAKKQIISLFQTMPYAIEIHHNGRVYGVAHGDVLGNNWNSFKERLLEDCTFSSLISSISGFRRCVYKHTIWNGTRCATPGCKLKPITGVDAVIFGHSITPTPIRKQNFIYIDTGAYFSHQITVLRLEPEILNNTLQEMPF